MTRAQWFTVAFWLALPGVLGFKGCYFGNDEVPLGSNARWRGAGGEGDDTSFGTGGEGGAGAASHPSRPHEEEPVFVLE